MAEALTRTNQFGTFEIFRDLLRTSTILNAIFDEHDYHRFDPFMKARYEKYPFILIEYPDSIGEVLEFTNSEDISYGVTITVVVQYHARSQLISYANEIGNVIRENKTTLLDNYNINAPVIDMVFDSDRINQKDVVVARISVDFNVIMGVEED